MKRGSTFRRIHAAVQAIPVPEEVWLGGGPDGGATTDAVATADIGGYDDGTDTHVAVESHEIDPGG